MDPEAEYGEAKLPLIRSNLRPTDWVADQYETLLPVGVKMLRGYLTADVVIAQAKSIFLETVTVEINIGKIGSGVPPDFSDFNLEHV